ncbi:TPA: PspC domain-containing protein [Candidatus Woesearchaeota archaeon]|nr:Stress-responsive transcriptional regulator [archaeon GW2011_AR15]MBS3103759.1 PspC domain-containing protein [Candidatus Woesearchaeota archaeon]HIH41050.1 PspC domain-containing protein [Candidatus Woesearchaeota archaeon]
MAKKEAKKKEEVRKLFRSKSNRVIAGVCGGIGEYFAVDPVVVRLAWVLFTLLSFGTGILIYIIAWLIIPERK